MDGTRARADRAVKKPSRRFLRFATAALAVGCLLTLVGFGVLWCTVSWTGASAETYPGGVVLRDAEGRIMRVSLGPGDVDCRPYYRADPNDWIVKALVAAEDGTFWTHCGVRPLSVFRAVAQNLTSGRRVSGASTLTMQAVRLIEPHPKSLVWKTVEAVKALKMERKRDKLWILSQYLNRAPFGSNLVGIEAAANGWFGKTAKELGVGEASCLAGMVQAPTRYRPDRSLRAMLDRRDYVLARMVACGYLSEEQRAAARTALPHVCRAPRPFRHPHFCDWTMERLAGRARQGGCDLVTALDESVQQVCERTVGEVARAGGYASAAVVLRVRTGEVIALACSGDYFKGPDGQVNTAAAPRPAGSTLKPFLAALALDRGLATPESRLLDVPRAYKGYAPTNFDAKFRGRVTLRDALVESLNLPFVQLLDTVGVGEFGTMLRALGFGHLAADDASYGLGMAIGNVEVSLVELVSAYGNLARAIPRSDTRANDQASHATISPGAAYLISDMLSGDERSMASLGHVADVRVPRFAWKTGTSAAYRDAWTVAWNPEYVVGVWCGHVTGGFGNRALVGAKASAPPCWKIARLLYPQGEGPWFSEPTEIIRRTVCSETGLPAGPDCRRTEVGRAIAGRTPAIRCAAHRSDVVRRRRLQIAKPEEGTVLRLVPGMSQQKVICQAVGNARDGRLWWMLDGVCMGESRGADSFALSPTPGRHELLCAAEDGRTATASFTIEEQ